MLVVQHLTSFGGQAAIGRFSTFASKTLEAKHRSLARTHDSAGTIPGHFCTGSSPFRITSSEINPKRFSPLQQR
jgi:hypothetical protein